MSNAQIEVVHLGERKYIGIAVTSPLNNVKGIGEVHQLFMERMDEIQSKVDESTYVCVHFANEVLFTYIYCMEVTDLQPIPEGMIGFEVPSNRYVKVHSNGEEPYGLINEFLRDNGMQSNSNSVSFEVFQFGIEESKYNAEILVPVAS
jgi:predicted transcriptional regulator YdeE